MSSAVGEVSTMAQGELARVCGSAGTSLGCGYLLGGQIDLAVETCSILLPQLRDGKLRPLGTPSPKRLADLPDIPTMADMACRVSLLVPGPGESRRPAPRR